MALLATGLAAMAAGAGCGSESEPPCRGDLVTRGCADLMNFSSVAAVITIAGAGGSASVPAATLQDVGVVPGVSWAQVPSNLDSQTTFELRESGSVVRSVTCTVGPDAWISVNPALVVQPNRAITCSGW